jgi:hypothetical protein
MQIYFGHNHTLTIILEYIKLRLQFPCKAMILPLMEKKLMDQIY